MVAVYLFSFSLTLARRCRSRLGFCRFKRCRALRSTRCRWRCIRGFQTYIYGLACLCNSKLSIICTVSVKTCGNWISTIIKWYWFAVINLSTIYIQICTYRVNIKLNASYIFYTISIVAKIKSALFIIFYTDCLWRFCSSFVQGNPVIAATHCYKHIICHR